MSHTAHVTTTTRYTFAGERSAAEAYTTRVHRLREARTPHERDDKALTVTYTDPGNGDVVTLRYEDDGDGVSTARLSHDAGEAAEQAEARKAVAPVLRALTWIPETVETVAQRAGISPFDAVRLLQQAEIHQWARRAPGDRWRATVTGEHSTIWAP